MAQIRPLNNAPIVEAVVELRVRSEVEPTKDFWVAIAKRLSDKYPKSHDVYSIEAGFAFTKGELSTTEPKKAQTGIRLESADGLHVVQFLRDRLICSRLRPYNDWEQLVEFVRAVWKTYRAEMKPSAISRVAARFVNQLEVPAGVGVESFLAVPPTPPDGIRSNVIGFNSKLMLEIPEFELRALSTVAVQPSQREGFSTLLIDNDVFRILDSTITDDAIFSILTSIRACKNQLFFGPLTESALAFCD